MNNLDRNTAILDALGIEWKDKHLLEVQITLRYDCEPEIKTTSWALDMTGHQTHKFEYCRLKDVTPFSLDEQCSAALNRVNNWIKRA
jgi:hypothetical protein